MIPLAERVRELAAQRPDDPAFICDGTALTWAAYEERARALAARLRSSGMRPGDRVGVLLPDGADVHVAFLANEMAGLITLGIGPRAALTEIAHLLRSAGARGLISLPVHQDLELIAELRGAGVELSAHLVPDGGGSETASPSEFPGMPAEEIFLLNSTSGTTGMPKIVVHDQARWFAFHELAVRTGRLNESDVFMSLVPAPFGFGLWTAHFSPALLGVPTVLLSRFSVEAALEAIESQRVTVLAAVSTQFILMLESEALAGRDLGSLRVLYTGGEAVPYERAAEFEERTGATVLQFYGSNETGAVSGSSLDDPREKRLRTAGRPIPEMNVRLFDEAGNDVTASGRGQPGCKGPTLSRGYWNHPEADRELIRDDGWMLLGDIVELDADGYLSVVGRTDDFIIRGGKNISGPAVEQQVAEHPAVALAAAVAMPDPIFGERVCVYVELREGASLSIEELIEDLARRRVSKENFPERLEVVEELPRSTGGKIAKQRLRDDIAQKLARS